MEAIKLMKLPTTGCVHRQLYETRILLVEHTIQMLPGSIALSTVGDKVPNLQKVEAHNLVTSLIQLIIWI